MLLMSATRHSCGGPVFGRLTDGCPRCDELRDGATPIKVTWYDAPRYSGGPVHRCSGTCP